MQVRVHVIPGARREQVIEERENDFTVSVKEPAERNQANRRVRELMAAHFSVRFEDVRPYTGVRGTRKVFTVVR